MAERVARPRLRLPRLNLPLFVGTLLVLAVAALAIWGDEWAPHDPMEENAVLRVGAEWLSAPAPPLKVPGYPLGTDELGRDLVSRLMVAVRPTMTVVGIAATLRLLIGTALGIVGGWSRRWPGRAVDSLMSAALSLPTLLVALAAVVALQGRLGLWAFVVGLALTGWAEAARLVREQVRLVRGQSFIEAARALGGSDGHIVWKHVLRQIMPLLWLLLAFELSSTLLVLAGLGFIGYFVGGEIWVPISDFVAGRFSGAPELGQMLNTSSTELFTNPWRLFATGGLVFLIILGFNLLGEGLRQELAEGRRSWLTALGARLSSWLDERLVEPLAERRPLALGMALVLALALGSLFLWQRGESAAATGGALPVPGGHEWGSARGGPYGTLWRDVVGPAEPTVLWSHKMGFDDRGQGLAIDAEGTLYVTNGGSLRTIAPDGTSGWEAFLQYPAVGAPALDAAGTVYVADIMGGLSAFDAGGHQTWRYNPPPDSLSPTSGPIVIPNGAILYPVGPEIQAISPAGSPLWRTVAAIAPTSAPLVLSADGEYVAYERGLVRISDGVRLAGPTISALRPLQFFTGADGATYLRHGDVLARWEGRGDDIELTQEVRWEQRRFAGTIPNDAGVTPSRTAWMIAGTPFQDAGLFWVDMVQNQSSGTAIFPYRPARVIAVDGQSIAYVCGLRGGGTAACAAFAPTDTEPRWALDIPDGPPVAGAISEGRLYILTASGVLHAIGQ